MNLDSIKELMAKFAEMDKNGDGLVCMEEFAKYLNLPRTPQVEALFRLYDRVSAFHGNSCNDNFQQ